MDNNRERTARRLWLVSRFVDHSSRLLAPLAPDFTPELSRLKRDMPYKKITLKKVTHLRFIKKNLIYDEISTVSKYF